MNKKIVINSCRECPKANLFSTNYGTPIIQAWCGMNIKVIPEKVYTAFHIWSECKLQDNNNDN